MRDGFPYYKIITGETSEARVTFGSPTVYPGDVAKLARSDRSVYLVLRESMMLQVDGQLQPHAAYVIGHLGPWRRRLQPSASWTYTGWRELAQLLRLASARRRREPGPSVSSDISPAMNRDRLPRAENRCAP